MGSHSEHWPQKKKLQPTPEGFFLPQIKEIQSFKVLWIDYRTLQSTYLEGLSPASDQEPEERVTLSISLKTPDSVSSSAPSPIGSPKDEPLGLSWTLTAKSGLSTQHVTSRPSAVPDGGGPWLSVWNSSMERVSLTGGPCSKSGADFWLSLWIRLRRLRRHQVKEPRRAARRASRAARKTTACQKNPSGVLSSAKGGASALHRSVSQRQTGLLHWSRRHCKKNGWI